MRARRVDFRVRFYPYAGLTSTIHKREDHYEVKLADILESAPLKVHYALAAILLGKMEKRLQPSAAHTEAYEVWARRPDVLERHSKTRQARARKRTLRPPQGQVHDLKALYRRLNREYFGAVLPEVELGWSAQAGRTRFGYHDSDLGTIVINRRLDEQDVPAIVVAYVLYHEMLHVKHGIGFSDDGRRVMHPPQFKADERLFPAYASAERHLARLARERRRATRRAPKS
jgi:hypothetical protein